MTVFLPGLGAPGCRPAYLSANNNISDLISIQIDFALLSDYVEPLTFYQFCLILRCSTATTPGSAAQLTCSANFSCPVCVKKHFQNQIFPTPNNYPILFPFSIELAIKVTLSVRAPQAGSTPSQPPPINHHLQCFTELLCGQRSLAGQNARTCVKNQPGGTGPPPATATVGSQRQPSYDFFSYGLLTFYTDQ